MIVDSEVLKTRLREAFGSDSQETIGKNLNMSQGNISKILSGSQTPALETVFEIAKHYGVSVDWLLGLSNKKSVTHYSTETTYASVVETLIDLKNHGAKVECNAEKCTVLLQTDDELLSALMNKALTLKSVDYKLFQKWIDEDLSLFADKHLLYNEVWKVQDVYFFTNEAVTETDWLKVHEAALHEEERIQKTDEPE